MISPFLLLGWLEQEHHPSNWELAYQYRDCSELLWLISWVISSWVPSFFAHHPSFPCLLFFVVLSVVSFVACFLGDFINFFFICGLASLHQFYPHVHLLWLFYLNRELNFLYFGLASWVIRSRTKSIGCVGMDLEASCFFLTVLYQIKPLAKTQWSHKKLRALKIKRLELYALLLEIDINLTWAD